MVRGSNNKLFVLAYLMVPEVCYLENLWHSGAPFFCHQLLYIKVLISSVNTTLLTVKWQKEDQITNYLLATKLHLQSKSGHKIGLVKKGEKVRTDYCYTIFSMVFASIFIKWLK